MNRIAQQLLRPDIAFVIKLAVATLGKFYAKPFGHGNAGQANVRYTPSAGEEETYTNSKKHAKYYTYLFRHVSGEKTRNE